jgi:hypothetical protein
VTKLHIIFQITAILAENLLYLTKNRLWVISVVSLYVILFKFRMLWRYWKIKGDIHLTATGDRGHHSACDNPVAKQMSSIFINLHQSSSSFIYLP